MLDIRCSVQCSYLWGISAERLLKFERNDPGVVGLILDGTGWVEGSGRVFGDNKSLNRIQIYDAKKDKSWLVDLCQGLSRNRTLESLSIESSSWCKSDLDIFGILSPFLEHNSCLRSIDVSHDNFGALAVCLSRCKMGHLEFISVSSRGGTEAEAATFFDSLNEQPKLTDLAFRMFRSHSRIGVDCITILKNALNRHNTLLLLVLRIELSEAGWEIFLSVLSHPQCSIQTLEIEARRFNVIHLARALAANNSLRHLCITCDRSPEVTIECWDILSRALCDVSSIERTWSSNHMLHKLVVSEVISANHELFDDKPIPSVTSSLLEMNKNENKAEVARQKILTYHFSEEGKKAIHVFAHMPVTTIPVAIAWIGRDRIEFTLMYDVVRAVPALFERLAGSGQNEEDVNMQY